MNDGRGVQGREGGEDPREGEEVLSADADGGTAKNWERKMKKASCLALEPDFSFQGGATVK